MRVFFFFLKKKQLSLKIQSMALISDNRIMKLVMYKLLIKLATRCLEYIAALKENRWTSNVLKA